MMPFATFSNSDGIVRMTRKAEAGEFGMWMVRLWFKMHSGKTEHAEITTKRPCSFHDLRTKEIDPEINLAFDSLHGVADSGFTVYKLRGAKPNVGASTHRKKKAAVARRAAIQRATADSSNGNKAAVAGAPAEAMRATGSGNG